MNNCLVTTKEIRDLAKKLQGETEESVKGLVALWQKENNKSIEEYPTAKELNNFRVKLRGSAYKASVTSYTGDITPDANTIFVFGSNPEGKHGAGAAKIATIIATKKIPREIRVSIIAETTILEIMNGVNTRLSNPLGFCFIVSGLSFSNASAIDGIVSATKSIYNICKGEIISLNIIMPIIIKKISAKFEDKL